MVSIKCRNHCDELRRNEQTVRFENPITTRIEPERHTKQKGSIPFALQSSRPCLRGAFSFAAEQPADGSPSARRFMRRRPNH